MANPSQADYADCIISNCQRLIVLVQVVQANPTPTNLDAVVNYHVAGNVGALPLPRPQPRTSVDGESYDWDAYVTTLTTMIEKWVDLRQVLGGAFSVNSVARY